MRKSALALSFVSAFSACGGNLALDYFRYVGEGQPIVLRVSQAKGDGNANEPYSLKITSAPSPNTPARD